jgi:hypothetical protein
MKNSVNYRAQPLGAGKVPPLAVAILLGMALCCSVALSQNGSGSIQGTVTDSTGAVVPGASIHVVNDETAVTTDTKSNGAGFFQVPELFTGHYTVTASASGMKTYKTSIELLVAQSAVINPMLTAGAVSEEVVVSGDAVQLTTTDNGAITSTLENERISQLPMNGRTLSTLVELMTPGLENGGENIDGMKREALDYMVDGVSTQNVTNGGAYTAQQQLIDPDAVQEVTMDGSNSSAQYATPATAIVTTKSGTNGLHGTSFETARNNAIGVAKSRQNASNYSAPHLVRNEFGASAGGPIVLPHVYHGKDKSFWFFAYERYSQAGGASVLAKVPTPAMSQGDFSGLINGSGVLQTIYDPATTANSANCAAAGAANAYCRTPFPNNKIPSGEISPVAKIYYQMSPPATSAANPLVTNNFVGLNSTFQVEPQETVRLDHVFNDNNRAFLRYTQNLVGTNISGTTTPRTLAAAGIAANAASPNTAYSNITYANYLASVSYSHVFSPSFFEETVASSQWFETREGVGVAPKVDYESMLGLPNNFGEPGFPLLGNGTLIFNLGTSQTNNAQYYQVLSSIDENLTWTEGRHQMQFGGRFRHLRQFEAANGLNDTINISNLTTALYNASSGANYTALTNTGYADASFFLGSASSYSVNLQATPLRYRIMEVDGYFQDNYHVSRSFTVNLGLRYEAHPGPQLKDNLQRTLDLKNDAEVLGAPPATLIAKGYTTQAVITNDQNIGVKFETPAQAGMPASLYRNYNLTFLPRVGFAYQPFGAKYGTVIRGGYGRYIAAFNPNEDGYAPGTKTTPFTDTWTQSYTNAAQAIDSLPNELIRYNDPVQFGVMGANTSNVVNTNATNSILPGLGGAFVNSTSPPSADTEVNFTIEQPLKGNSVVQVSWVFTHATNLLDQFVPNHAPSTYQWELANGTAPPTGGASVIGTPLQNTYAATATGPYDQTTWGAFNFSEKDGWSNDNALHVNYQRLFHHGIAYQINYVFSRALHLGSNTAPTYASSIYPSANYPGVLGTAATLTPAYGAVYPGNTPPARPAGWPIWAHYHSLERFEGYGLDATVPIHHINFNGIIDLPFGRGKRFLGNANRFMNELVGGFQLAGDGTIISQSFQPSAGNWGAANPIQVYKHKVPITDCRSGICYKEYMWFNGYLAPTVTTGTQGSVCTTNCVSGLPANYVPFQAPIDNMPGTTYFGDNEVQITAPGLNSGKPTPIVYDAGPQAANYLSNSWLNGPINWSADASLFKVLPITERVNLRFNVDAFNVFNVQGEENPGTNGIQMVLPGGQSISYNPPRQIQLTARLTF